MAKVSASAFDESLYLTVILQADPPPRFGEEFFAGPVAGGSAFLALNQGLDERFALVVTD